MAVASNQVGQVLTPSLFRRTNLLMGTRESKIVHAATSRVLSKSHPRHWCIWICAILVHSVTVSLLYSYHEVQDIMCCLLLANMNESSMYTQFKCGICDITWFLSILLSIVNQSSLPINIHVSKKQSPSKTFAVEACPPTPSIYCSLKLVYVRKLLPPSVDL